MLNFEYYSPTKIYFGKNREDEVGKIIKGYGYKKILLHYGKGSIKTNGLYDKIMSLLKAEGIEVVELGGVEANPKLSLVKSGIELVRKEKVEMILAVGGGSVIDSSKAIACGYYADFDPWLFNIHEKNPTKALPIGVILTISAAGSELSNSCVITNEETKVKSGFNNDIVRPLFSIMDPTLTFSVSKFQTGCGIVDIMMHTLERYLVDEGRNELQLSFCEGLLHSVMEAGKVVINNPSDYEGRATLMLASSFSHNGLTGIGSKMYFTVHKIEHEISGMFDYVAHGAGLSVLFIAWAKYLYQDYDKIFSRFAYNVMGVSKDVPSVAAALEGITKLEAFFRSLGMPTRLEELHIDESKVEEMAKRITKNDTTFVPGIKKLNLSDVINIFELTKGEH